MEFIRCWEAIRTVFTAQQLGVGGGLLMELPEVKWLIVLKWKSEETFQRRKLPANT